MGSSVISREQIQAAEQIIRPSLHVEIAHGTAAVDVEAVERAAEMATVIKDVSQRFLTDWATHFFAPRYLGE